jgi:hypothetical protein
MASSCVVTVVPGRVVPGVCTRAVVEAAFSPHTVLGTSEARAHVTRLRCGTLQNEIGMWTQTERDLRARNDCGHVTGKLTGPVDVSD